MGRPGPGSTIKPASSRPDLLDQIHPRAPLPRPSPKLIGIRSTNNKVILRTLAKAISKKLHVDRTKKEASNWKKLSQAKKNAILKKWWVRRKLMDACSCQWLVSCLCWEHPGPADPPFNWKQWHPDQVNFNKNSIQNQLTYRERGSRWQLEVSVNFRRHGGMCEKSATTDPDPDPARELALIPMSRLLALNSAVHMSMKRNGSTVLCKACTL